MNIYTYIFLDCSFFFLLEFDPIETKIRFRWISTRSVHIYCPVCVNSVSENLHRAYVLRANIMHTSYIKVSI